jgi:hypothetical protein
MDLRSFLLVRLPVDEPITALTSTPPPPPPLYPLSTRTSFTMSQKLRVGWHREHFLSPLLQLAEKDVGSTFELVECPGGTGEMQVKLRDGEIDLCIGACSAHPC